MKVLVMASGNHERVAPFVSDQMEALRREGCDVRLFAVEGHGARGYLGNWPRLRAVLRDYRPDVIHAHYGLCGLLCTLQRRVPTVVTFHGSDINNRRTLPLCRVAMRRAAHSVFVGTALKEKAGRAATRATVLPCGVDLDLFVPMDAADCRRRLGLRAGGHYILFAGAFDNPVKNIALARAACRLVPTAELLELKGYTRQQTAQLMNAADCLLMTSHSEGSPQVVKEALAVGLPVVSVDVGDVRHLLEATHGGSTVEATPQALAAALQTWMAPPQRTDARRHMQSLGLDNRHIAQRLIDIFHIATHPK